MKAGNWCGDLRMICRMDIDKGRRWVLNRECNGKQGRLKTICAKQAALCVCTHSVAPTATTTVDCAIALIVRSANLTDCYLDSCATVLILQKLYSGNKSENEKSCINCIPTQYKNNVQHLYMVYRKGLLWIHDTYRHEIH